jgi:hypothetical protein
VADWASFYVMVGSAAAALIGMQFIVITLLADRRRRPTVGALDAFATPTVVHLTGALLVSAIMSAPWRSIMPPSSGLATYGVGGLVYSAIVIRRARRQTFYEPVWQDWLWYAWFPCAGYAALALASAALPTEIHGALFAIAGAALGLLLIGIHNAWDTVTHIVVPDEEES